MPLRKITEMPVKPKSSFTGRELIPIVDRDAQDNLIGDLSNPPNKAVLLSDLEAEGTGGGSITVCGQTLQNLYSSAPIEEDFSVTIEQNPEIVTILDNSISLVSGVEELSSSVVLESTNGVYDATLNFNFTNDSGFLFVSGYSINNGETVYNETTDNFSLSISNLSSLQIFTGAGVSVSVEILIRRVDRTCTETNRIEIPVTSSIRSVQQTDVNGDYVEFRANYNGSFFVSGEFSNIQYNETTAATLLLDLDQITDYNIEVAEFDNINFIMNFNLISRDQFGSIFKYYSGIINNNSFNIISQPSGNASGNLPIGTEPSPFDLDDFYVSSITRTGAMLEINLVFQGSTLNSFTMSGTLAYFISQSGG